jgi:outer membrane immunogenic protein
MKSLILAATTAALLGSASFAFAADLPVKAPVAQPIAPPSWTGFYIGAHGGWAWSEQNDWSIGSTGEGLMGQGKLSGGLAGGQFGYNWQMGSLVFGLQGDGSWANIHGNATNNSIGNPDGRCWSGGDQTANCSTNIKGMGNLTARIGFLPLPNTLFYGKFGVNWSALDFGVNNVIDRTGGTCGPIGTFRGGYSTNSETRTGLTAGIGVEQRFYDNWSVFGEYNVIDNGATTNNKFTGGTGASGCTPDFTPSVTTRATSVLKFGVNFQFH